MKALRLGLGVAGVISIICLTACGSDHSSTQAKTTGQGVSSPSTTGTSQATGPTGTGDQPTGSLNPQEYRLMASAMTRLKRSGDTRSPQKAIEELGRACKVIGRASTPLMAASHDDCLSTVAFLEELASVPRTLRSCGAPVTQASFGSSAEPDPMCLKRVLGRIRDKAQTAIKTSTAVNQALTKRQIRGRCRRLIGTSRKDLRSLSEVLAATDALDVATDSTNRQRISRAVRRFQTALGKLFSGPDEDPVKLVRGCRP